MLREDHFVQSLERGLSVITAFGPTTPELSLSDVARATGLTRAAARRGRSRPARGPRRPAPADH